MFEAFRFPDGHLWLSNKRQQDAFVVARINYIGPDEPDGADQDENMDRTLHEGLHIEQIAADGRTLSQMLAGHRFISALRKPCILQLYNYDTHKAMLRGQVHVTGEDDPVRDRLMAALQTIQDAFLHLSFVPPLIFERRDIELAFSLAHIITDGQLAVSIKGLSVTMLASGVEHLPEDGTIEGSERVEQCAVNVWGTMVPLGEVHTRLGKMRTYRSVEELKQEARQLSPDVTMKIDLVPAQPEDRTVLKRFINYAH